MDGAAQRNAKWASYGGEETRNDRQRKPIAIWKLADVEGGDEMVSAWASGRVRSNTQRM